MEPASVIFDSIKTTIIKEFSNISKIRGSDPDAVMISTLLMIEGELSQKEIHEQTKISRGKISNLLKNYVDQHLLIKELVPGTHEYRYKFNQNLPSLSTSQMMLIIQLINSEKQFVIYLIEKIYSKNYQDFSGVSYLIDRLSQIWDFLEKLERTISSMDFKLPKTIERPTQFTNKIKSEYESLDEKLNFIRDEIIQHYCTSNLMKQFNNPTAKTLVFFFLKENLIQKEVISLTGFSPGAISLAFAKLEDMHLITRDKLENGTFIWKMPSISKAYQNLFLSGWNALQNLLEKFTELKTALDSINSEMKENPAYKNLKDFLNNFFSLTPIFKKFNSLITD